MNGHRLARVEPGPGTDRYSGLDEDREVDLVDDEPPVLPDRSRDDERIWNERPPHWD